MQRMGSKNTLDQFDLQVRSHAVHREMLTLSSQCGSSRTGTELHIVVTDICHIPSTVASKTTPAL